jgi:hypothetical protein
LNIQKKSLSICLLFILTSSVAVLAQDKTKAVFTMTTTFAKNGWEKSPTPRAVSYGNGYLFVRASWDSVPVEQGIVRYKAWIRNINTDWESADTLKVKDPTGKTAWMQDFHIPAARANKNTGVRGKLSFGFRPARGKTPQVMPLKPGKYQFELCAQRILADGKTELEQHPFEVTINPSPTNLLILSGIADFQVFQRTNKKTGDIDFYIINDQANADYEVIVKSEGEQIAKISGTCSSGSTRVKIKDIPVGGSYTVEISAGKKSKVFKDIYVGDLWIVSGQSNAVGCGHDTSLGKEPMAGVHCLAPTYNRWIWGVAKDGFFGAYVGPWVTAAQEYYKETGVPVGLMGHAVGGQPMDFFMDDKHQHMPFLKRKIKDHAANAALFMWYQGESDTFIPEAMESYDKKLVSMAKAMRSYTGNPELKIGIVQLSKYLWFRDEHFAEMREIQRQFVLNDKNSVLFSTIGYEVNNKDKIHLTSPGQVAVLSKVSPSFQPYFVLNQWDTDYFALSHCFSISNIQ